ncbi:hypothetical protein [Priestia megaterium]|uniref:hypothetical protein n=1 Tax=Priestia megaterium TaxID=1404 RepID=UPI000CA2FCA6|nr:hypothetical protein [Priestia megaterium]AUO14784.1 hypothetical protein C0569_26220 [Priestia megaterium]
MNFVELSEHKSKKEGKVTPKRLVENLLAAIERGEVKEVVIVSVGEDELVRAGWSQMSMIKAVGLLEVGKDIMMKDMEE